MESNGSVKQVVFNGQIYDVRMKRNGGRIQIDFGVDAVEVVSEISRLAAAKDMNFQIVIAILQESV